MPVTLQQYERSLAAPALCEQLRIRDLLDNVAVHIDGSLVAGYELGGVHSYFASDEMRNRAKNGLEALVRSLPERSMRMQVRRESLGPLREYSGEVLPGVIATREEQRDPLPLPRRRHDAGGEQSRPFLGARCGFLLFPPLRTRPRKREEAFDAHGFERASKSSLRSRIE
jgi:hypothetical protein